ncbi:MAG TPA: VWA domain-containing protein [Vicinamibacterales bacterium]|nr:VWA domain-containing protein [Vicinamibacterales bacterium]
MRVLRPEFAPWWQILPVLLAFCMARLLYLYRQRVRAPIAPRFLRLSRRATWKRGAATTALALIAGGALVAALVRPQARLTTRVPQYEREDLVIMLDRSASMRAHDVMPSRFARATDEIRDFIRNKPEYIDRVGLVGFAGSAVILSYLTRDLDTVAFYLDWIEQDPQTLLGTDIGAALKNALEVARKDDRPTRKIFVLLSDGEDYGDQLTRQVAIFRQQGHHINSIGIGSDGEVAVPVILPDGRETPLRDESGRVVRTRFEEATLRRVAVATGGRYVRSRAAGDLTRALREIEQGERKLLGWSTTTDYRDVYPEALLVAAAAIAALWILQ